MNHGHWLKGTVLFLIMFMSCATGAEPERPTMKEFIGINGHFSFKPDLYRQVCERVRNYHNMDWDVAALGDPITFPICTNNVNWEANVYTPWKRAGFETDICVQFGKFGAGRKELGKLWSGKGDWLEDYGFQLAKYFGPSSQRKLATSVEIDNEPGTGFPDGLYQQLFKDMAAGVRKGDPKMKIVTCAVRPGKANTYVKSLEETFGGADLKLFYDVINLHLYAQKSKGAMQSPWERSYPEDPALDYLKELDDAVAWRDREAPGKEIWITEFGYDSCTDEAMRKRTGWFEKLNWRGVTDLQQAQYLIRSLLCFSERDVARAYIYFYDDNDKAEVHGASGLTRHFQPKPSYWAVRHFYQTLGNYRFNRVITKEEGKVYAYELVRDGDPNSIVWVAWSPTGSNRVAAVTLTGLPIAPAAIEQMPTEKGPAPKVAAERIEGNNLTVMLSETPIYIMMWK